MKKILLLIAVFCLSIGMPLHADALMGKPTRIKAPPMSTEDDGYRAETDPLPEWLYLPDGVDENSLSFSGDQTKILTMKQSGSSRWEIQTHKNGAKISYSYFESGQRQFVIATTKNYAKLVVYLVQNNGKLKKVNSVDPESYFDDATPLSLDNKKSRWNFSLHAQASALNNIDDVRKHQANAKRVKAKLSKRQINKLNHKVGFKGNDASIANKVAYYESAGGKTQVVACENNTATGFNPKHGGVKGVKECMKHGALGAGRGLYQISSNYHSKCTNKCAFNPESNAKYAYKIRKQYGWTIWCSYGGCGSNDPNPPGRGPAMN
jgi:hypothetical protein